MIERSELHDAAQKAFPADALKPDRDQSWQLAAEMGWLMMPLSEEDGGLGLGADCVAAIHYELGKVLATAPLIPALLAVTAIGTSTELEGKEDWVGRVCGGEFVTTPLLLQGPNLTNGNQLDGALSGVPDADMASHIMVITSNRELCALVPVNAAGVTIIERPIWDKSRRLFDVTLNGVAVDPALVIARGDQVAPLAKQLKASLLLALAADSLGGATALLDMSVEYLKTRKQFDRPLAMFQALKHRCADLKTAIAAAEALFWSRAVDADATLVDLGALKAHACEVYRYVTEEAVQLHGGIGLTDEHPCHLFLKRALLNIQLGGDADYWQAEAGKAALKALTH